MPIYEFECAACGCLSLTNPPDDLRAYYPPDRYYSKDRTVTHRRAPLPLEEMAAVYASYVKAKRDRRVIDFEDMLASLVETARRDHEFAAELRASRSDPLQFARGSGLLRRPAAVLRGRPRDPRIRGTARKSPRLSRLSE